MKKIILIFFVFISLGVAAQSDTTKIIILHTNDMHSKIDRFPQMAYHVKKIKQNNENVLLFSAGDNFTGNPIVDMYKEPCYPIIDLMNEIGFDLTCLGNHEFDYGQDILNDRMKQADFPHICANVSTTNKSKMNEVKDYCKFSFDNVDIGVVGFVQLEENMLPATNPVRVNTLSFEKSVNVSKNYTSYKDSVDILIALTHLGVEKDKNLAQKAPFFDIIVGGHSHTTLPNGFTENGVFIVQAGAFSKFLGVMTIKVVDNKLVSVSDSLINLSDNSPIDDDIKAMVDEYNNNPVFDEILAENLVELTNDDELGALLTDAIVDTLKVDIAFQNIGGIRMSALPAGNISKKQIFELSPFGNIIVVYKLNLEQIKELIRYAYDLKKHNEVQVSGINIWLKVNKKGELKKIKITDKNNNKLENKFYTVAINDYMSNAYDLSFLKNPEKRTSVIDAECVIDFLKKKQKINYSGTKRIFIK